MGCGPSALIETPEDLGRWSLTWHWVDTLRLVHAPSRSVTLTKKAIQHNWKPGIGANFLNKGAIDYELKGRPFIKGANREEMTQCKRMAVAILEYQLADGWVLEASADLSRIMDQTTWFFKQHKERGMGDGKPAVITCFSFQGTDDIHLVRANSKLLDAVRGAIKEKYPKGSSNPQNLGDGDYVVRLNSHPWTSEGQEGMDARHMFLGVIRRFQSMGYYMYGTCNITGTADCVYFVHHPDGNTWYEDAEYAIVSLNDLDKVRFIDLPNDVIRDLKQVALTTRGSDAVQRETEHYNTYELKLKGTPWCAEAQDVVISRLYVTKMLECLAENGWTVMNAVDMSRKMNDKAVFILRSSAPTKRHIFCLAAAEIDKLRVINGNDAVVDAIRRSLIDFYQLGIAREDDDYYGCHEFKLKGQPWYGRQGSDELFARSFMLFLLKGIEDAGYECLVATDVSAKHVRSENGPDYPLDTHSWFFANKL